MRILLDPEPGASRRHFKVVPTENMDGMLCVWLGFVLNAHCKNYTFRPFLP